MFPMLATPTILIDYDRLIHNIHKVQAVCDSRGVALWPHIKTHKTIEISRLQLEAGAKGLVCAKIGEAEALLPSGVRRIFIAHSLVDPMQGKRLRALAEQLEELIVACTSIAQGRALEHLLSTVGLRLPVMLALNTGLEREGVRSIEAAVELAGFIRQQPHLELKGIYTHEGHAYRTPETAPAEVHEQLMTVREQIGGALEIWPGCSVTAISMAQLPGITGVRPGTYVFGDLNLIVAGAMDWDEMAATILATVVDRPEPKLALVDAGSKTFSSDKTSAGLSASAFDRRDIHVFRCSEEHGFVNGEDVDTLQVGERLRFVPAHVCPTINLTDELTIIKEGVVIDRWRVAARGKVQ